MTSFDENKSVGEEAYRTFHAVLSSPMLNLTLGMFWLAAFSKGYDFRKNGSVVDKVSSN